MDVAALKAKEHKSWSTAFPAWKRYDAELVAWAAPVSDRMVERLAPTQGQRILDLASGTGEPALAIAERVGPLGAVHGFDIVAPMLEFAREKASRRDLRNIEFKEQDIETLDVAAGTYDGAAMRFGLMFFPQPVVALKKIHHALKAGARIVLGTWAPADKNPWAASPMGALKRQMELPAPPPGTPGLFAMSDPERLKSVLSEAGFKDIQVEAVPNTIGSFRDGASYCEFIFTLSGPLADLLAKLPADKQAVVRNEVTTEIEGKYAVDGRLSIPGVAWVVTATK